MHLVTKLHGDFKFMIFEKGQMIKTSYGTGPYEITGVLRNCECPHIIDTINNKKNPKIKKHVHLTLRGEDGREYWLNYYSEETLKNVYRGGDEIILLPNKKLIQLSML